MNATRDDFRRWVGQQILMRDGQCSMVDVLLENIDNAELAARGRSVRVPRLDNYVGHAAALERESAWIDEALDYLLAHRPLLLEGAVA